MKRLNKYQKNAKTSLSLSLGVNGPEVKCGRPRGQNRPQGGVFLILFSFRGVSLMGGFFFKFHGTI